MSQAAAHAAENVPAEVYDYEPKVVSFCCTFCSYTAADLAGSMRLQYPSNVRIVKILCTGKIDPILLLKSFEAGADAVYVAGCALGDCHFLEGNVRGKRAVRFAKELLKESGIEPERLEFFHVPASAGPLFAQRATEMDRIARTLGPSPIRRKRMKENPAKKAAQ
jgi:coenzyme F420-reducing hydrogenase delta subunit